MVKIWPCGEMKEESRLACYLKTIRRTQTCIFLYIITFLFIWLKLLCYRYSFIISARHNFTSEEHSLYDTRILNWQMYSLVLQWILIYMLVTSAVFTATALRTVHDRTREGSRSNVRDKNSWKSCQSDWKIDHGFFFFVLKDV